MKQDTNLCWTKGDKLVPLSFNSDPGVEVEMGPCGIFVCINKPYGSSYFNPS